MTLLDDAARLVTLASEADAAADAGSAEAALTEVLDRLRAVAPSIDFGILDARWWTHVPEDDRATIRAAAERARSAVEPLTTESDEVLAAYGRGDAAMDRGALAMILSAFRGYRTALQGGQEDTLQGWGERLWPSADLDKLHVHAVVPETTAAANEILVLLEHIEQIDLPLDEAALRGIFDRCAAAETSAATLRSRPLPPAVLAFFESVREHGEVSLSTLTLDVFEWLMEHDATRLFVVGRSGG
jgi:hypothetical protein